MQERKQDSQFCQFCSQLEVVQSFPQDLVKKEVEGKVIEAEKKVQASEEATKALAEIGATKSGPLKNDKQNSQQWSFSTCLSEHFPTKRRICLVF